MEVNSANQHRQILPKSKSTDLVSKVAVALITLTHTIFAMLTEQPTSNTRKQITEECYKKSMAYVHHLHSPKEMFFEFIKTIIKRVKQRLTLQPTAMDIKAAFVRFPGRILLSSVGVTALKEQHGGWTH